MHINQMCVLLFFPLFATVACKVIQPNLDPDYINVNIISDRNYFPHSVVKKNSHLDATTKEEVSSAEMDLEKSMVELKNTSQSSDYSYYAQDDKCTTVGGKDIGAKCIFPFIYYGTKYKGCTSIHHTQPWCATIVDGTSRGYVKDMWGICASSCKLHSAGTDGSWTGWGQCSKTCEGGLKRRNCSNPFPDHGGADCAGNSSSECNKNIQCGIDASWTEWGQCSTTCEGGLKRRNCLNPFPDHGGADCAGNSLSECNKNITCGIDGSWTEWGQCSKTCEGGLKRRNCSNPFPDHGGADCAGNSLSECNKNKTCVAQCSWPYYTVLNDAWRKIDYYNRGNKTIYHEHRLLKGNWYRLAGPAGTQLPTSPAPNGTPTRANMYCGTHVPAYMTTNHPTPQDGIVSKEVCFEFDGNKCYERNNIKVAACYGEHTDIYYVYELGIPEDHYAAYCAL